MKTLIMQQDNRCLHYCSIGGHVWAHECERDSNGVSDCGFKLRDKDPRYKLPVVKFLQPCDLHAAMWNIE